MKKNIIRHFNRSPATYLQAASLQQMVANELAQFLPSYSANEILEIGCGTGLFSQHLITQFPRANVMLTDIAPAMIAYCQKQISGFNIDYTCVDSETAQLQKKFNLITSSMTLHWFQDFQTGFNNVIKHLDSKGTLLFSMLGESSLIEWQDICKQSNIAYATPSFLSESQIKKMFPNIQIQSRIIQQTYTDCYHFLKHMKLLGAHTARPHYSSLSAGKLRQVLRQFMKPITISYHILYGIYTQP